MTSIHRALLSGLLLLVVDQSRGLATHSVRFPLNRDYTTGLGRSLANSFDEVVDSTDFFFKTSEGECSVPLFGDDTKVTFGPGTSNKDYVLTVEGDVSPTDFGWICTKFFECEDNFDGIRTGQLRRAVAQHMNAQPPQTGYDASLSATSSPNVKALFEDRNILKTLEKDGFVVIDSGLKTTSTSNQKLSEFLVHSTGQARSVRRDKVAFLDSDEAESCDLTEQFDVLMGVAAYLNNNLKFQESPYRPLSPGTKDKPLSNPKHIQAAEYGEGDFYIAHSDNSLTELGVRSNYRCYTCILYCNDDWTEKDGGALRIYPESSEVLVPLDAKKCCASVDVNPANGQLLIFDSKLVHSVEKVTQSSKTRRALTLWILRPEESGARGEVYYFGEDEN